MEFHKGVKELKELKELRQMSHCLCCWTFVLQLNNKLSNKAIVLTPLTPLTPY